MEKVSWTEYNPGRKFLTCANGGQIGLGGCGFFQWSEEEMNARTKSTNNGLIRCLKLKDDEHFAELIS